MDIKVSSSSKFYFQQNTTMKQYKKIMVNIRKYIKALLHIASALQGSCKAHQAGKPYLMGCTVYAPPLPTSHGDANSSIYIKSPGTGDCHLYGESMGNCLRHHVLWFQFALKIVHTTVTRVSLHKEHTLIKWPPLRLILEKGGPTR